MRFKILSFVMLVSAMGFVPAALALDRDSSPSGIAAQAVQVEKLVTVPLSLGRLLNVHLAKMGNAPMVIFTIEDLIAL